MKHEHERFDEISLDDGAGVGPLSASVIPIVVTPVPTSLQGSVPDFTEASTVAPTISHFNAYVITWGVNFPLTANVEIQFKATITDPSGSALPSGTAVAAIVLPDQFIINTGNPSTEQVRTTVFVASLVPVVAQITGFLPGYSAILSGTVTLRLIS